jgi:hypothetical protein
MVKFQDNCKIKVFPNKIYIIESQWFNSWKTQVKYDQFEPKKASVKMEGNPSFFGNWNKP